MLVHTNSSLECGISGLRFHKRNHPFSTRIKCSFPCLTTTLAIHDPTRNTELLQIKEGHGYTKIPSQVIKKTESNGVVKKNAEDLILSSSYESAMEALSSLITRQKRGGQSRIGGRYGKLERMLMYLKILGLEDYIAELKVVHVAGTKGKGSTCSFCEAILRECGFRTGLFTSPHLIDVRERFHIDGLQISEDKFLHYFWDCWSLLKENVTDDLPMPPLFQFLTLLAFKIFVCEQVDVAVIEVGLGGTKDSTNVIKEPIVCGITSLGLDHTDILGNTLRMIASHKAGIFKPQIPAFTVPQLSEAMEVLQERALQLAVPLEVAAPLDIKKLKGLNLSLSGDHQFINAGLAVSLCNCWLKRTGNWEKIFRKDGKEVELPEAFLRGLSTAHLSGRAQIVYDNSSMSSNSSEASENSIGDLIFYLDGAHTPESMEACAKWFSSVVKENSSLSPSSMSSMNRVENMDEVLRNGYMRNEKQKTKKPCKISKQILLFNCMEGRDPQVLLSRLVNTCASSGTHFSKALFVPSISKYSKVTSGSSAIPLDISGKDLSWQFNLQRHWERIIRGEYPLMPSVHHQMVKQRIRISFILYGSQFYMHFKELQVHERLNIDLTSKLVFLLGSSANPVRDKNCKMDGARILPPRMFLYEDASHYRPGEECSSYSAVLPSLPRTINYLRDCVKENPSIRVQVLVTGSLHLVGDVLKLLKR